MTIELKAIKRYPVKGMRGVDLAEAKISARTDAARITNLVVGDVQRRGRWHEIRIVVDAGQLRLAVFRERIGFGGVVAMAINDQHLNFSASE